MLATLQLPQFEFYSLPWCVSQACRLLNKFKGKNMKYFAAVVRSHCVCLVESAIFLAYFCTQVVVLLFGSAPWALNAEITQGKLIATPLLPSHESARSDHCVSRHRYKQAAYFHHTENWWHYHRFTILPIDLFLENPLSNVMPRL